MAKKEKHSFQDQSVSELEESLVKVRKDLFQLRNEKAVQKKLEKPSLIRKLKKDQARILTFLTQKQREIA